MLPELVEGTEDGGFGDLFAELGGEVVGAGGTVLDEQVVGVEREGANFGGAAGGGWLLPGLVAAKSEDVGEGGGGGDEVGGVGGGGRGSEQVERNGGAFGDEAGEEEAGFGGLGERGGGVGGAERGLDERRCGGGDVLGARGEEEEARGGEEAAGGLKGQQGHVGARAGGGVGVRRGFGACGGVLSPVGEAGGGELIGRGWLRCAQGDGCLSGFRSGDDGRRLWEGSGRSGASLERSADGVAWGLV